MLEQVKKYGIIIIIAILFTVFSFSIVDVVVQGPDYRQFCSDKSMPARPLQKEVSCPAFAEPAKAELDSCASQRGFIDYSYDSTGCPRSYECNTCSARFEDAGKQHRLIGFIITSVLGVIAIVVGLYSRAPNPVVEWIYSGFLIGGIMSVAFGTMSYFHDMGRFTKPVVLLVEMVLIILIALKTALKKK